jgi:hypothetical protein
VTGVARGMSFGMLALWGYGRMMAQVQINVGSGL